ncbi:hypothetical protein [Bartonella sp. OT172YNZD]|uniref:hypothetical protein n=1 Tax=Bartonella sp. OT172YNZD TaxID=3243572 RepID=UPI0035D066B6
MKEQMLLYCGDNGARYAFVFWRLSVLVGMGKGGIKSLCMRNCGRCVGETGGLGREWGRMVRASDKEREGVGEVR